MRHGKTIAILVGGVVIALAAAAMQSGQPDKTDASIKHRNKSPLTRPATRHATTRRVNPVDEFFAKGTIPYLKIEIAPKEMEALRKNPRAYAKATVREVEPGQPDKVYTAAAVHLKGMWGSFRGVDDRPAFTISFHRYGKGETFHGLYKLHLNNSVQDPTYLSENMGRTFFRAAGVPVPRAGNARVWFNGKDMGFYVLLEGLDRSFLKRSHGQDDGIVFEGNLQEIDQPLNAVIAEKTTPTTRPTTQPLDKDSPEAKKLQAEAKARSLAQLKKLVAAVNDPNPATRRQKIEEVVDVDRFFTFMAMESLTAHWDGYCGNRNNYRMYQHPKTGKFIFMAHGMDQLFQQPGYPLIVTNGAVARVLLESAEDKWRYIDRLAELRQKVFTPEALTQRIDEIAAHTIPAMAEISPDAARQHKEHIAGWKQRVLERVKNVDAQLAAFPRPLKFNPSGIAAVSGWQLQQQSGSATFDRIEENGRTLLRLRSAPNGCIASLRTKVLLPRGKYIFGGNCRAAAITPADGNGGLVLRISGATRIAPLSGTTDWSKRQFEFEVGEPSREVVLVCELRAKSGEAWFDAGSLTIQKR